LRKKKLELGLLKNTQALKGFGVVGLGGKHPPVNVFRRRKVLLVFKGPRLLKQC
jgi:hypothetical protein